MSNERIAVEKRNGRLTPAAAEGEGPAEILGTSSDNPIEISHGLHENLCSLDIQLVQNLVERCLQLYMNQSEVVCILQKQAKIDPGFTALVWQKLEEQNPTFFEAYHARLRIQDQMIVFNQLVQRHFFLLPRVSPELPNYHWAVSDKIGFPWRWQHSTDENNKKPRETENGMHCVKMQRDISDELRAQKEVENLLLTWPEI